MNSLIIYKEETGDKVTRSSFLHTLSEQLRESAVAEKNDDHVPSNPKSAKSAKLTRCKNFLKLQKELCTVCHKPVCRQCMANICKNYNNPQILYYATLAYKLKLTNKQKYIIPWNKHDLTANFVLQSTIEYLISFWIKLSILTV